MTRPADPASASVWAELVGQDHAVETLARAAGASDVIRLPGAGPGHAMSHAWLITGPPGSGRSNAAKAFAAALQCENRQTVVGPGCGQCNACRTSLTGAHPDVTLVRTEQLSIGVDEVRELVRRASMRPTMGRRQILVVEDADRVTERGADALLKSIEEPAAKTVWVLCAPTADDVVATIRSRCRLLNLTTPSVPAVTALLEARDGFDPAIAAYAARAGQGHIGRARMLARDEGARNRRHEVLQIPGQLRSLGACLTAAENLVDACTEEAAAVTKNLDARELADLSEALGMGTQGSGPGRSAARPRQAQAALKELEDQHRARAKRLQRDALDRALTELTAYYRDVLSLQLAAEADLVNPELQTELAATARRVTPEITLRRIDAILACRVALETNVAPLLAVESMLIGLVEAVAS